MTNEELRQAAMAYLMKVFTGGNVSPDVVQAATAILVSPVLAPSKG